MNEDKHMQKEIRMEKIRIKIVKMENNWKLEYTKRKLE